MTIYNRASRIVKTGIRFWPESPDHLLAGWVSPPQTPPRQHMALINIDTALKRACEILDRCPPPQGLEILTYKRNRGVGIIKLADDLFLVRERGYHEEEWELDREHLSRQLKAIAKREFPRSHKVRIYQLDSPDEMEQPRKKL